MGREDGTKGLFSENITILGSEGFWIGVFEFFGVRRKGRILHYQELTRFYEQAAQTRGSGLLRCGCRRIFVQMEKPAETATPDDGKRSAIRGWVGCDTTDFAESRAGRRGLARTSEDCIP